MGFEAHIVPENVTLLPKTQANPDSGEHAFTAKKGENVGSILHELGVPPDKIKQVLTVLGPPVRDGVLKEGEKVRVLLTTDALGRVAPLRVIVSGDRAIETAVALSDMGSYVPVDIQNVDTIADTGASKEARQSGPGVSLYQSLWETALYNKVPQPVIEELVRIYAYDVDFQRKVQPGDSFDVLYAQDTNGDGTNEVRYASLTTGGETKKYYHFQTADDGMLRLLRRDRQKREEISRTQAGRGSRHDLAVRLAHTSADSHQRTALRRRLGGTVRHADLRRRQRHDRGDRAARRLRQVRAHQATPTATRPLTATCRRSPAASKSAAACARARSSASSARPASRPARTCHFEILVNERFVDPMRIKLPRGRVLDGGTLAQFEKDRTQLDAVMVERAHHRPRRPSALDRLKLRLLRFFLISRQLRCAA